MATYEQNPAYGCLLLLFLLRNTQEVVSSLARAAT
jgi:hypothetical protein